MRLVIFIGTTNEFSSGAWQDRVFLGIFVILYQRERVRCRESDGWLETLKLH
jgi:hypothetical protein